MSADVVFSAPRLWNIYKRLTREMAEVLEAAGSLRAPTSQNMSAVIEDRSEKTYLLIYTRSFDSLCRVSRKTERVIPAMTRRGRLCEGAFTSTVREVTQLRTAGLFVFIHSRSLHIR